MARSLYCHSDDLSPQTESDARIRRYSASGRGRSSPTDARKKLLRLILHGSAASAGFEVERSDLDILAIIKGPLTPMHRATLGQAMLSVSNDPHPSEFSMVREQELQKWEHPCEHQFPVPSSITAKTCGSSFLKVGTTHGLPGQWCTAFEERRDRMVSQTQD